MFHSNLSRASQDILLTEWESKHFSLPVVYLAVDKYKKPLKYNYKMWTQRSPSGSYSLTSRALMETPELKVWLQRVRDARSYLLMMTAPLYMMVKVGMVSPRRASLAASPPLSSPPAATLCGVSLAGSPSRLPSRLHLLPHLLISYITNRAEQHAETRRDYLPFAPLLPVTPGRWAANRIRP